MSRQNDIVRAVACDYVTGTTKERSLSLALYDQGDSLLVQQAQLGNRKIGWGMKGFSGWACGSVQLGTRGEECILRLSSDSAARHWKTVVQYAQNVTRLDLQATVKIETSVGQRIDGYRRAAEKNSNRTKVGKVVRWIREHNGGYTLYLGDRKSNVFGRIYDKHQDTPIPEYEQCIRFEAQFQKKLARFVAVSLQREASESPAIAGYVSQFFDSRGVHLEISGKSQAAYSCPRNRSDIDRNLIWLEKAVRPCISRIIAAGRGEELFRALGLITDGPTAAIADMDHETD